MSMRKRVVSILLSLSLLVGVLFSVSAAAAKEKAATVIPPNTSAEQVDGALDFIKSTLGTLLDKEVIFTNQNAGELIRTIHTMLSGMGLGFSPDDIASLALVDHVNNPLQAYIGVTDWALVDVPSLDWGVKPGDVDSFIDAVFAGLRPIVELFGTILLPDGAWQEGTPPEDMLGVGIPVPLYRFGLYPVFQTLGLKDVQDIKEYSEKAAALGFDVPNRSELMNLQAEITAAREAANQSEVDRLAAEINKQAVDFRNFYSQLGSVLSDPIKALVKDFFADPMGVIMEKLPLLDKSIRAGELDWVINLAVPDQEIKDPSLVKLVNAILPGILINEKPLGIVLPDYDFTQLIGKSQEDIFVEVMIYLMDVVKYDNNLASIKTLLAGVDIGMDLGSILENISKQPSNLGAGMLIMALDMMNTEEPIPPVTDPTTKPTVTDPSVTSPSKETTTGKDGTTTTTAAATTEEPTTGSDNGNGGGNLPQTGDIVLGMLGLLGISAAAVVVLRKKKVF